MVQLAVGPGGETSKLGVEVAGLAGGVIVKPLDVHAGLDAAPDGTSAFANVSGDMSELVSVSGRAPITTDQWIASGWAGAKSAPLTGKLDIPSASAVDVLAIIGRTHLEGHARRQCDDRRHARHTDGAAELSPTTSRSRHRSAIRAPPVLQELRIAGTWDGAAATVEVTGTEVGGGLLHVTATDSPRRSPTRLRTSTSRSSISCRGAFLPGPSCRSRASSTAARTPSAQPRHREPRGMLTTRRAASRSRRPSARSRTPISR